MDTEKNRDCSTGQYIVQRNILDELCLDEVAQKEKQSTKPTIGDRVKESLRCSVPRLKHTVLSWIPILGWLPQYSFRENIVGDLISGCSVGIMHLPQGMAYALLASLPAVYGLYTSFYPVLIYSIFGSSRHISIGTFSVVSMMIGSVTEKLAPDSNFIVNGTNGTATVNTDARDAYRVQIACAVTLLAGIFQILLGMMRIGFVVTYLSEPLVRGYTTASAVHVCVSQLKYLFGVDPERYSGPFALIYTLVDVCQLLPETRVPELVVSLVSLTVLIVVKEINGYYRQKLPLPIPIELLVVITATIVSYFCDFTVKYGIDVVGEVPSGLKAPSTPEASLFSEVIGDAFALAIVGYAICISLGKTFALKHGYKVDSNQELVALGLCNTFGGFFNAFAVTASLSRSLVQESTGCKTQVTGMISSVIVLITILQIGPLFADLPTAVLATTVFANLKGMFRQFMDVPMLWRTNKVDLLVWLATFVSTILFNLDVGLAISIGFSMLTFILRIQLPRYSILGQVSDTDLYLDTDTYAQAKEIPGIKIFRSSTTIYYTNAEMYLEALQEKSGIEMGKLLKKKKKRDAKLKRKQEKERKKAQQGAKKQKQEVSNMSNGIFSLKESGMDEGKVSAGLNELSQRNDVTLNLTETSNGGLCKGQVNWAYQHDPTISDSDSDSGCRGTDSITQESHTGDEETGQTCGSRTHSIILDISTTSFVDTVTMKTLKNIFRDFGEIDVDIYLAGCQACVVEQLETAGFFSESITKSRLFVTVHDAVLYILHKLAHTDFVLDVSHSTRM